MKMKLLSLRLVCFYGLIVTLMILFAITGSRAVTVVSKQKIIKERPCVIIDAGHGGVDGGATSCTGVLESKLNLEIAIRLNDLMHLIGLNTKMIRSTDISVYTKEGSIAAKKVSDLKNRVKIVNETNDAILISIHQNHFTDNRYSGAQVFYGFNENSRTLAKALQDAFAANVNKDNKRKAKKAVGVYLLQNVNCPAVLVECGFISNQTEESLLRDSTYQKKLCSVIAVTTSQYLCGNTVS